MSLEKNEKYGNANSQREKLMIWIKQIKKKNDLMKNYNSDCETKMETKQTITFPYLEQGNT